MFFFFCKGVLSVFSFSFSTLCVCLKSHIKSTLRPVVKLLPNKKWWGEVDLGGGVGDFGHGCVRMGSAIEWYPSVPATGPQGEKVFLLKSLLFI